jgi:hypothetical protein
MIIVMLSCSTQQQHMNIVTRIILLIFIQGQRGEESII